MYKERNKGVPEFYLERGYADTKQEAEKYVQVYLSDKSQTVADIVGIEKVSKLKSLTSSLRKENILHKFSSSEEYLEWKQNVGRKGIKIYQPEYWTRQGYTAEEAKEKISIEAKKNSIRTRIFWEQKGLSSNEIDTKLREIQNTRSKEKMIKRWGEVEATRMLQESSTLSIKFWTTRGYTEEEATKIISAKQTNNAKKQKKCKEYWMRLGHSDVNASSLALEYARTKSHWCWEYWVDLGYSKEDAVQMVSNIQSKNGKRAIKSNRSRGYKSRLEMNFMEFVNSKISGVSLSREIFIDGKLIYPDAVINEKLVVEIYGDFWHCNPKFFQESDIHGVLKISAKERWKTDEQRKLLLESAGYTVLVIWEDDLLHSGYDQSLNKIISTLENI
jgi:very-short-patch-repair endonuclease